MNVINLSELVGFDIPLMDEFCPKDLFEKLQENPVSSGYPLLIKLNVDKLDFLEFLEWETHFTRYMLKKNIRVLIG